MQSEVFGMKIMQFRTRCRADGLRVSVLLNEDTQQNKDTHAISHLLFFNDKPEADNTVYFIGATNTLEDECFDIGYIKNLQYNNVSKIKVSELLSYTPTQIIEMLADTKTDTESAIIMIENSTDFLEFAKNHNEIIQIELFRKIIPETDDIERKKYLYL